MRGVHIFKLQRIEWLFVIIIIMGGVAMYYIQGIIDPVKQQTIVSNSILHRVDQEAEYRTDLIKTIVNNQVLLKQILEQQGNLTSDQRIKLTKALQDIVDLIPEVDNRTNAMLNATYRIEKVFNYLIGNFGDEYIIDENRQYVQSNNTAGNLTILQDKLDQLLNRLVVPSSLNVTLNQPM